MNNLTDQLETKKKDLNDFQIKYNIRVKGDVCARSSLRSAPASPSNPNVVPPLD
jgi:hypothetical protein